MASDMQEMGAGLATRPPLPRKHTHTLGWG